MQDCPLVTTGEPTLHTSSLRVDQAERSGVRLSLEASPRNTAAKITNTNPTPDESLTKSTIAMPRNTRPASAFPSACFDIALPFVRYVTTACVGHRFTPARR